MGEINVDCESSVISIPDDRLRNLQPASRSIFFLQEKKKKNNEGCTPCNARSRCSDRMNNFFLLFFFFLCFNTSQSIKFSSGGIEVKDVENLYNETGCNKILFVLPRIIRVPKNTLFHICKIFKRNKISGQINGHFGHFDQLVIVLNKTGNNAFMFAY